MQNCPNTKPLVLLETARLILRPWETEDLAPFAHMNVSTQVMQHFPQTLNTQESDALADRFKWLGILGAGIKANRTVYWIYWTAFSAGFI
ncbi:hypothetical protein ACBO_21500 [Acinetobacter bouvetii]|nr:hypothetical protein ACBO_21500 [Acinetobacter bouvetii]